LLLSFIENSFKHGANKITGDVKIDIDFKIVENFLYFTVSNPLPETPNLSENIENSSGIGLTNVKKRLELGYKNEDYSLNIEKKNKLFIVTLKIKCNED
jgi:two-component system sensor histidine kinase AlgZ